MQIFNHDTINEKYKNCTLMVMHCYDAELILSNGSFCLFLLGNTKIRIEYSDLTLNRPFRIVQIQVLAKFGSQKIKIAILKSQS